MQSLALRSRASIPRCVRPGLPKPSRERRLSISIARFGRSSPDTATGSSPRIHALRADGIFTNSLLHCPLTCRARHVPQAASAAQRSDNVGFNSADGPHPGGCFGKRLCHSAAVPPLPAQTRRSTPGGGFHFYDDDIEQGPPRDIGRSISWRRKVAFAGVDRGTPDRPVFFIFTLEPQHAVRAAEPFRSRTVIATTVKPLTDPVCGEFISFLKERDLLTDR